MALWIGVTLGDVTGIGPEVVLKALAAETASEETRYLLIGDERCLWHWNDRLDRRLPLRAYAGPDTQGQFFFVNPLSSSLPQDLPPGAPAAANAAIAWLTDGAQRCLRGQLQALVTAPVNKHAIIQAGHAFVGQTEFLAQLAAAQRTAMMLLGDDEQGRWLRVVLVTTHLPIRQVADRITREKIELAIELAHQACCDLHLPQARIGVCGLNPHAGEGGDMGREDIEVTAPAVQAMQQRKLNVTGPLAADSLFYHAFRGDYDVVVAMYHDQGLVPLKMIGFERGINWTLGLPFIRTSPDHGTAYDIAGQGKASATSMSAAIRLARQLAKKPGIVSIAS